MVKQAFSFFVKITILYECGTTPSLQNVFLASFPPVHYNILLYYQ